MRFLRRSSPAHGLDAGAQLERTVEGIQDVIVDDLDATKAQSLHFLDQRDPDAADDMYAAWGARATTSLTRYREDIEAMRGIEPEADRFLTLMDDALLGFLSAASLFEGRDFDQAFQALAAAHEGWHPVAAEIRRITGQT